MNNNKFKDSFKSKNMKIGGYSILISVIVIAIAIAINYLVSALPTTLTKFDMTANSKYTLSEQTEKIVKAVDCDVNVYLVATTGSEDSSIQEVLKRYQAINDKISIIYKDPALYPTFTEKYTSDQVSSNSLIVESDLRYKVIGYSDIYVTDYSSYYTTGTTSTSFDCESQLTSAINYVTTSDLPKMYLLTGHGEADLSDTLSGYVQDDNITTESISLLAKGSVPEDCDCLLIYSPTSDISEDEKAMILTYMENGGNVIIVTSNTDALGNLYALGSQYGINAKADIIFEGSGYYYQYPYYLLAMAQSHTITDPLISDKSNILEPIAHVLTLGSDLRDTLTVTGLLETSDSAYAKADPENAETLEKVDGDLSGPFYTAIAAEETIDETSCKMVWFSCANMFEDQINQMVSGANDNLLLNSIGWMCDREETISIRSVSLDAETLVVNDTQKNFWMIAFCIVIPVGILVYGFTVWNRRRKAR